MRVVPTFVLHNIDFVSAKFKRRNPHSLIPPRLHTISVFNFHLAQANREWERDRDRACSCSAKPMPDIGRCAVVGPAAIVSRPDVVIVHRKAERDNAAVVVECRCHCPDKGAKERQIPKSANELFTMNFCAYVLCASFRFRVSGRREKKTVYDGDDHDKDNVGYLVPGKEKCSPIEFTPHIAHGFEWECFVAMTCAEEFIAGLNKIYRKEHSSIQAFSRICNRRCIWQRRSHTRRTQLEQNQTNNGISSRDTCICEHLSFLHSK